MVFTLWERECAKKSRLTEDQIAFAIKQPEQGAKVEKICLKMGISDAIILQMAAKVFGAGILGA